MYANNNKFLEFISKDYDGIKEKFKNRIRQTNLNFDDDIFSDTILKCNDKLSDKKVNDCEMLGYFWNAFKINTIRDLGYSRNKVTDELPEISIVDNTELNHDFNVISELIINKFGKELFDLFMLHANGTSYNDINKISDIDSIKYKFRKIRNYVRKELSRG